MSGANGLRIVQVTTVPQTLGFFADHINYLKARGFEIHLVSSPGEKGTRLAAEKDLPFHPVPMSRTITPVADWRSFQALRRLFKEIRPHIVHSHTPKAGLLGTLGARTAGVPIVFLSIFGLPQMTLKGPRRVLLDILTRLSCRMAHRVWIDSPSMKDHIVMRRLCPASKAVVIGNGSVKGVNAESVFSPEKYKSQARLHVRGRLGFPVDSLVIGYVGRIVRDKGMHELAQAWRSLKPSHPELRLLLVGEMEAKDPIRPEDRTLFETDPDISMPGATDDVPTSLSAMDIFVMPSYREGFGMTNIEAAAMALPVVSTAIPGCVDSVVDGITGTLVPSRDCHSLANAINAYIVSPELRMAHGAAGRVRVLREFRPEEIMQGLYLEYRHMLESRGLI